MLTFDDGILTGNECLQNEQKDIDQKVDVEKVSSLSTQDHKSIWNFYVFVRFRCQFRSEYGSQDVYVDDDDLIDGSQVKQLEK